jgi:hypothetical protein
MEQTESGILVPDGTIEKKVESFSPYETEAFRHAAKIMIRHNMAFLVVCRDCQAAGRPNPMMEVWPDANGRLVAVCECREVTFRERRGKKIGL